MKYTIKWHPQAFKVLKKLPKHINQRVLNKLDVVAEEPFRFLEHFEGHKEYKLRIGDYRALIEVRDEENLLLIKVFDHRGKVYKRSTKII